MSNRIHAAVPRRWGSHVLSRLAVVVAAGALFVFVMAQSWSVTSGGLSDVEAERHGVAYLQPLVQLVGELTDAQSAAVRGTQPNATQIDAAVTAVDGVDDTHGDALGAHRRWSELRGRIATLMGQRLGGEQAYAAYSSVVALAVDLIHKIGDTSRLVPDPQLDTYYLADATLLRVPDVLVGAGRAADLAVIADRSPSEGAQTRVSVARYQVSVASEQLNTSLHKALDHRTADGTAAAMGPNLAGQLDAFTSAVDAFVPPAMWLQSLTRVDTATLTSGAERVRQQTRPLAGAGLAELDSLLRERQDRLSIRQTWTMLGAGVGLLLLGALLSLLLPARPQPVLAESSVGLGGVPGNGLGAGFGLGAGAEAGAPERLGMTHPGMAMAHPPDPTAAEELLHVGRAVRAHRREQVGDVR
ncbi:hypothetical protein [Planosporangium mesophilum]|uniref:Nitrate/nitrite sensing protein domain-containing protein n=1 Tax=Planosporangium mesophilum TaxID=689768 RepID=A0A8J3X1G0_9ACTN|nr:hypothetical protein [Planosporangium mesophilum]NJC81445.1 hypothetical protein [Planosporangium mesophilum]GII20898.1 hypothetical protein Pme01_04950 [Planosporangium mesophilum]